MIEVMVLQTADGHMVHVGVVAAAELAPVLLDLRYLIDLRSHRRRDMIVDHHGTFRLWLGHFDGRHNYSLRLDAATEPVNTTDKKSQGGKCNRYNNPDNLPLSMYASQHNTRPNNLTANYADLAIHVTHMVDREYGPVECITERPCQSTGPLFQVGRERDGTTLLFGCGHVFVVNHI